MWVREDLTEIPCLLVCVQSFVSKLKLGLCVIIRYVKSFVLMKDDVFFCPLLI